MLKSRGGKSDRGNNKMDNIKMPGKVISGLSSLFLLHFQQRQAQINDLGNRSQLSRLVSYRTQQQGFIAHEVDAKPIKPALTVLVKRTMIAR